MVCFKLNDFIMQVCLHAIGIIEPCNVTICEGRSRNFSCTLKGTNTRQILWYRFIKDASEEEMVYPNDTINFTTSAINSTHTTTLLTITNATKSYTGYYWVMSTSDEDNNCKNISLTVTTSTYCICMQFVVYSLKLLLICRAKIFTNYESKGSS